jgi:hypothetical protein
MKITEDVRKFAEKQKVSELGIYRRNGDEFDFMPGALGYAFHESNRGEYLAQYFLSALMASGNRRDRTG